MRFTSAILALILVAGACGSSTPDDRTLEPAPAQQVDANDEREDEDDEDEDLDEDDEDEDLDKEEDEDLDEEEDDEDEDLDEEEGDEEEGDEDESTEEERQEAAEPGQQSTDSAAAPAANGLGQGSTWQPWEWRGWEKFPSLYFAAEPEGPLNDDQLAKIGRFSLAIIEFRAGQFAEEETSGEWAGGDLAGFMEQHAAQLKAANPSGPPVLTYRSGMWAGSMFSKQWEALQNQSLFIADERLCDGFISYPKDVDESGFVTDLTYCRWDFTKPATQAVFADLIADAAQQPSAGVFFDNAQSVACDDTGELTSMSFEQRRELALATEQVYREVFTELVTNGKYPILSTTNSLAGIGPVVPWENDCPEPEDSIIAALDGIPFARNNEFWMWNLGEFATNQILNSIQETERGIPIIVHMPWFPNDGGCLEGCQLPNGSIKRFTRDEFLEFGVAAFLVSMGPGSYFGFSDMQSDPEGGGWFDESWDYLPHYDEIVTGPALASAEIGADGTTFTRLFANGTVWVNSADGTYGFELD